jgi:hypothetical protein
MVWRERTECPSVGRIVVIVTVTVIEIRMLAELVLAELAFVIAMLVCCGPGHP